MSVIRSAAAMLLMLNAVLLLQATQAAVQRLDARTAGKLWKQGYAYLDVRTAQEFAAGHVPYAINVPWVLKSADGNKQTQNPKFLQQVKAAFPDPAAKFIVGCQTGRRSAPAAAALAPHYQNMVENEEGWVGWMAAGLPATT